MHFYVSLHKKCVIIKFFIKNENGGKIFRNMKTQKIKIKFPKTNFPKTNFPKTNFPKTKTQKQISPKTKIK